MPRKFNLEKILEDSYTIDLTDVKRMMGTSSHNFLYNVRSLERYLSVDWDDEVHIISIDPGPPPRVFQKGEEDWTRQFSDFSEWRVKEWMKVGRRVSYLLQGVGPGGEEVIYYRRASQSPHSSGVNHIVYIDGERYSATFLIDELSKQGPMVSERDWED